MLIGQWVLHLEPFTLCRINIERQNSISNGRIQYYHLGSTLVLTSKVILEFYETYYYFFLSMREQVINLLRPVGKGNPACYSTRLRLVRSGCLRLDIRLDCSFQQGVANTITFRTSGHNNGTAMSLFFLISQKTAVYSFNDLTSHSIESSPSCP